MGRGRHHHRRRRHLRLMRTFSSPSVISISPMPDFLDEVDQLLQLAQVHCRVP
jgi:hypothetical protein